MKKPTLVLFACLTLTLFGIGQLSGQIDNEKIKDDPRLQRELTKLETLFVKISDENSANVRINAAKQLADCSPVFAELVCNQLEKHFHDKNKNVRAAMISSFGWTLVKNNKPCPVMFVKLLKEKDQELNLSVRNIVQSMESFDEGCLPVLVDVYDAGDWGCKANLIVTLALAGVGNAKIIHLIDDVLAADLDQPMLKNNATVALWYATNDLDRVVPEYIKRVNETFAEDSPLGDIFDDSESKTKDYPNSQSDKRHPKKRYTNLKRKKTIDNEHSHDHDHSDEHEHAETDDSQIKVMHRFEHVFFGHLADQHDKFMASLNWFYDKATPESRFELVRWIHSALIATKEPQTDSTNPADLVVFRSHVDLAKFKGIQFDELEELLEKMIVSDDKKVSGKAMMANQLLDNILKDN